LILRGDYGTSNFSCIEAIIIKGHTMPHILVAGKIHERGLELLRAAEGVTFDLVDEVTLESYAPLIPRADAILIRTQPLPAEIVETATKLKIVSRHGVGFDAVDVSALNARKIPLCIVGDVNSRAVAEHTLMLMLSAARRIALHDQAVRSGNWNERNRFDATELDGKTLLLLGFGRIGRRVALLAQAFGMSILAYDPFVDPETMNVLMCQKVESIEIALPLADFVSLHLPASKGPVIGSVELARMKSTAILINAARGELVDEIALDASLRAGHLRHAALDVLAQEPPNLDHPLLSNSKVTLSPHNAGLTDECAARMAVASVQNILDYFNGKLDRSLVVNARDIGL
jgi:D-3-phosphoglycerate dehydrogenase / 2-oxoglutarate reductase